MRFILGVTVGFLLACAMAEAGNIASPPLVQDKQVYLYLKELYNNLNSFPVTTTNPNGTRRGRNGDTIWWNDSGTYRLRVNTDTGQGGTTWVANS